MKKKSLREKMPLIAFWIDELRDVFGADSIDEQIKKSMKGESTFFASENGHEFGVVDTSAKSLIQWDEYGRSRSVDIPAGMKFGATLGEKQNG